MVQLRGIVLEILFLFSSITVSITVKAAAIVFEIRKEDFWGHATVLFWFIPLNLHNAFQQSGPFNILLLANKPNHQYV